MKKSWGRRYASKNLARKTIRRDLFNSTASRLTGKKYFEEINYVFSTCPAKLMSDLEENIKRINSKLQQLLKNYQLLQKENNRQSELIKQLKGAKEKDNQQITALHEKISILKAATGKMNEADKKAFEKNISQYIREIDKCIGILSE